jgi:type VI protein secretion system component VasK
VPDEIKADYQVIAENFKKIAEALKGVDLTSGQAPSPEALAKLQELSQSMDSPKVQQATQHIEAWVKENC